MSQFYSTSEVAKMCQVTTGSINRWIHEGKLKAAVTAGGHHRISSDDLLQFLGSLGLPIPEELSKIPPLDNQAAARILIVDDEPGLRDLMHMLLAEAVPGATIDEAADSFVAGWKAHELKPHLVILDLLLPGVDGFKFCEFIRSLPTFSETRIIVVSGLADKEAQAKTLSLGADDFLTKPFDPDVFKKKVMDQLQALRSAA